jgi:hypothetical protein
LIVHGTKDSIVAPFLGDEVFVGLRRLGKEVEYAKYQGEEHSPFYWSYQDQLDFANRIIEWFDLHLKEIGSVPPTIAGKWTRNSDRWLRVSAGAAGIQAAPAVCLLVRFVRANGELVRISRFVYTFVRLIAALDCWDGGFEKDYFRFVIFHGFSPPFCSKMHCIG